MCGRERKSKKGTGNDAFKKVMVRPRRFERLTHSLEGCCSIQLSYLTILIFVVQR